MRIVSLAPSNTEILFDLGVGDQVIAVTRFCDTPAEAKEKPQIGGWLDVDDSLVEKYNPDVVMTSTFVQDKVVERYQNKGIEVFHTDPKTLEQVYESIVEIGKLVDREEKAVEIVQGMKAGFQEVEPVREVKVYCEEWHNPPMTSGNWVPRVIEYAGGKSMAVEGIISREVTLEEVQDFDPDFIVLSLCGFGNKATREIITERKGWEEFKNIILINDSLLNRPGPRLVEGARVLAKAFRVDQESL